MRPFLFYFLSLLLFSYCSKRSSEDEGVVVARVGPVCLNEDDLLSLNSGVSYDKKSLNENIMGWIDETVFLSEALKEGFNKDANLLDKREAYFNKIVVSAFIESFVTSKVSISKEDIRNYYKRNKGDFVRNFTELQVEHYIVESMKDGNRLAQSFNSNRDIKLNKFNIISSKTESIKRGVFSKEVDDILFIKKKKVVGPFLLNSDISVLRVIGGGDLGSQKGLSEVYDEIYQRLFKIKSLEVEGYLLDSLKETMNISINSRYQIK